MTDDHPVSDAENHEQSQGNENQPLPDDAGSNRPPDDDLDEGLAAQLRALRDGEDDVPMPDAPLWGFDREAEPSEQVRVPEDSGSAHRELADQSAMGDQRAEAIEAEDAVDDGSSTVPGDTSERSRWLCDEPNRDEEVDEEALAWDAVLAGPALVPDRTPAPSALPDTELVRPDIPNRTPTTEAPATDQASAPTVEMDNAAWAAATAPVSGSSVSGESPVTRTIDMGPESGRRGWVWAVIVLATAVVAGAIVYGLWWTRARPVEVPDIMGKRSAEAVQAINDRSLRLGSVSEAPTNAAPPGTIVIQVPSAGTQLKPGDEVDFTLAAAADTAMVPDLTGTTRSDALETLAKAKLLPHTVNSYSATMPVDSVIAQLPSGGSELPAGSTIAVVVSKGKQPSTVVVPKVTGLNEAEAVRLVSASNLDAAVYRSVDPSTAAGEVIRQYPSARTSVVPETTVQILISQGAAAAPVAVPDVAGKTSNEARKAIEKAGLKVSLQTAPSATVAPGKVINQMPAARTRSAKDGVIGLLVSGGNMIVSTVPSLIGTDTAAAEKAVSGAGYKPVVLEVETTGHAAGKVFAQFPSKGIQYAVHFPVVALVARTPTP